MQQAFVVERINLSRLREELQREGLNLLKMIGPSDNPTFLVVEMPPELAETLKHKYKGVLIIEEDAPLDPFLPVTSEALPEKISLSLVPLDRELEIRITVKGDNQDKPVPYAEVRLIGSRRPATGLTDINGQVTLKLYGESRQTLRALHVIPRNNYWDFWLDNPDIDPNQDTLVLLKDLDEFYSQFPEEEMYGWGHQTMRLDKLKGDYRGQGIKIAVIDSGVYTSHQDLYLQAEGGRDFTQDSKNPEETWREDETGHGSHVTGVIAALHNAIGIKGFAPEAKIYAFKIFPGGTRSSLLYSLEECINLQIDVVNLSLGEEQRSELVYQQIQKAWENGVACIAAAGNSRGKVQYPAAFPEVLAVSAIGKLDTFPKDSYHNQLVGEHKSPDGQYFTAKFSCFGDQIDVCAPGVAVVSCVHDGTLCYAVWDGTSMACPHVVGLAALILEAREDIRNMLGSNRVQALFAALKESAEDLGLPRQFQGAGLPNVQRALGVAPNPQ